MPSDIQKKYPNKWVSDEEDEGKNLNEAEFMEINFQNNKVNEKFSYNKITNINAGKELLNKFSNLQNNKLNVIVYNFVDMLSHARTDMAMVRELAATAPMVFGLRRKRPTSIACSRNPVP